MEKEICPMGKWLSEINRLRRERPASNTDSAAVRIVNQKERLRNTKKRFIR